MAESSTSFYLAPACWKFKNGDKIFGATAMKNVRFKRNINKAIIYYYAKGPHHNQWHETRSARHDNVSVYQKRSFICEYSGICNFTKTHRIYKSKRLKNNLWNTQTLHSMPSLNIDNSENKFTVSFGPKSCHQIVTNPTTKTNFVVNTISNSPKWKCYHTNTHPYSKLKYKVYRCQFNTKEESCCCSCNSDAMFEVMKSLYDCYKKKNCDNCNCILCGHLPREERRLGELRKSDEKLSKKLRLKSKASIAIDYEGKSPEEKETIFREMAMSGVPLPEGKTKSEKELIKKVRTELGLPPEPLTSAKKKKMLEAYKAGLIKPLEGKTTAEKEKILTRQAELGIQLPEGRTSSEKALIEKVQASVIPKPRIPSEKLREAKAAGLLTPLEGKSRKQKEKILKGLAMQGIPLPEASTASDQKLMDKVRVEVGLPPEPKTRSAKEKYDRAMAAGLITPLEGKSIGKKEKILREQARMGLPLPEGRTPSEKALIAKVRETTRPEKFERVPSEKLRKAKAAGLLTPLQGKSKDQKEKILKGLAIQGIPLPEAETASEQKLIDRIRADVGLPPEPKTRSAKEKYDRAMAAGLITPLEGKSIAKKEKILRDQARMGLPLPEGRTPSEKALIAKVKETTQPDKFVHVPPEKLRKAKEAGLLTPLKGKSKDEKENILKGLAMQGIPLPEAQTSSEQKLMDRIRADVGLPPEPKTRSAKEKYDRAMAAGLITPLEGKSIAKKEKILRDQARMGLPLPEGRTPSEKALIAKVKETTQPDKFVRVPPEKLRKAKEAGLLTSLKGKSKDQKEKILKGLAMQGIPLPEAQTSSEQKLMDRIRAEVGLPPEPKTPSAKEKHNRAMAAGIITPLEGKSISKKEKILREQAKMGLPLPEGRTPSEKALIAKVKETTRPDKFVSVPSEKLRKAKEAGLLTPLQGKSKEQKEQILKGLAMQGIPLPEAETTSEQKLMDKVRAEVGLPPEPKTRSAKEKYERAMAAGLITPLEGKSIGKKEKILREQAKMGLALPEGRTPSEKGLIGKVRETTRPEKFEHVPSEKLRKAKAAGLLTPLQGKSKEQKERILKGLAMQGIPLPEAETASEQKLMDKVRAEVGLPPEHKSRSAKEKYDRAMAAGLITPLEGKSIGKKEKILREQAKMGLVLPEGRTPSEKALIAKVRETTRPEKFERVPSEKLRKAKAAGLLTPLQGKSKEQKEQILKGLAMRGIPLPEPETASEQKLMDRIRTEVGLPPEPKTPSAKVKYNRAMAAGLITPLEGKSAAKKKDILRTQAKLGIPLPEGRTPSEKALIAKIQATTKPLAEMPFGRPALPSEQLKKLDMQTARVMKEKKGPSDECICDLLTPESEREPLGVKTIKPYKVPSEKMRKAKAAGLLTPLEGKSKEKKEKILRGLAMQGIPLPEAKTSSDKKLMDRIRAEVGLPPEPKTRSAREKYDRAMAAGLITPLEGKSIGKKEKILRDQARMGLPLPEGRTPSEKALIAKVKEATWPEKFERVPSEKLRKAKAAGLLTPLQGKSKEQKERILKGLAMQGIPLPEAETASEQKLMDKVRAEVGLPPEPKSRSAKEKYDRAMAAGVVTPLEGKSIGKKEKILRDQARMGLPLPEGRTPSEKALIAKVKETTRPDKFVRVPSEKLRKAKEAGLLTPLQGKSKDQKGKILKGLAMQGIPLPEAQTASEQKLMDQIRAEVGLPPEPKTPSAKEKYNRAMAAGIITPLEGKSIGKKEKILRDQARMGLPLPEGRTPSEKALIAKVKETTQPEKFVHVPSEKLRKAKAAGLLTPLKGKSKDQKEKILKGLAMQGIPLPEAQTSSEQKLMDRIRAEVGLPPEPKTPSAKEKYNRAMAAGIITPLEGKSIGKKEKILRDQAKMGLPLPEGRTPSEKALIAKVKETTRPEKFVHVPSEKLRKAKAAGLLTPLKGKSKDQKERILKGLAMQGIPLPEAQTSSEQKLIERVRAEVGLPPEPKTPSVKEKYDRAMAAGIITPLEGKSIGKKEKILRDQARMGLPLPEGRTPSEKALIAKVKETTQPEKFVHVPSEKLRKAKAAGLLTPLKGKSKDQKEKILKGLAMQGIPLPEAQTSSEQKLMDRIRAEVGLPPEPKTPSAKEKYNRAMAAGIITPLEGKSIGKKEKILRDQAKMGLPLPEGRTPSEKALIAKVKETTRPEKFVHVPSEKLRKAKAAGLLTPLKGKSKDQKERILKGLAMQGIPLPEAQTSSEQKLIERVRAEVGLPPEPKTPSVKEKYDRAMAAGIITPLEGKSIGKKEKILRDQARMGLPLPEGRTPSEKALIAKVKQTTRPDKFVHVPSEKLRKAKEAGLLTPLQGKSKDQKEKILKGLAMQGIPLPEAQTSSEQKLIERVRAEVGLPPEPKTPSAKEKFNRAMAAGIITPLEGKSIGKKEKILRDQARMGLPLPEGRTPSEKALIAKVKETTRPEKFVHVPSEKLRKAKAAGLLTPLKGKPKDQKERILKGLAMQGIPLPEAQTSSEQKLIERVRAEVGLPPEPKTPSAKEKYNRAMAAGIITPLEGKSIGRKERILRDQARMGLPLPEGRTPSEKALIAKVKETTRPEKFVRVPSEKLRKAKAAGLLTPLTGKSKEQKEKILKGLAMQGIPLPEAQSVSEQKLMDRIRAEVGLPPEPKTPSAKEKYNRAMAAGIITPLEGKSVGKKERILRDQARMGLPLPEGRTPSEKALIAKVKETTRPEKFVHVPSEKLRKAKAAGLLTPLKGKSKDQKERILKGLAMQGIPLPQAQTSSEQKLIERVRAEVGLPPEPKTPSAKEKYDRAMAAGIITPLEGKSIGKKEKILRDQARMGLPLPEGRTPSEKALIAKVKETTRPEKFVHVPSEKLRKAKAAGLLTPLKGKSKDQKEKILKGLAMQGIPLPEAQTSSEQKLMDQIRAEVGLPPEPKTPSVKEKYDRAMAAGIITPLEGKSIGKKEKILRDQARMGLPLPEGRTPSEKALIAKVKETTRPEKFERVPSEKLRKAKAAGLLTPLKGKSKEQKEQILKGLAMRGIPLPEAETASEQKLMDRIRTEVGLPPEPKTPSAKVKYNRAMAAGLITPLEGKSAAKKEDILRAQAKLGIPLPEGQTSSEKALIAKIKATTKPLPEMPAGRPALPTEQLKKLDMQTARLMKEKKGPSDECICDLLTPEYKREPFVITAIKPYKVPSEKMRKAKAAGLLTPLAGKSKEQKEKILRGLAMQGIPLPEAQTLSEQKLMDRIRTDVGLPPEPKTPSAKEKYDRAMAAGIITPLEGKSIGKKEKILRDQARMGLPLPEGRTPSEKALIAKVKETTRPEKFVRVPSEKLRKAKAAGLLTPLKGKSKEQKEKILKGLAMQGIPLPEAQSMSEQKLMDRIRAEVGLPPEPKTPSAKEKYDRAMAAGIITPLEGKSIGKKEKILRDQARMGLPLPEGRTPSEKALIAKVKETTRPEKFVRVPSEKLRKAKAAGLLTPLTGKSKEQKEKILKGLAMQGIPLPEAQSVSEQKLMDRIRAEVGLPPEPKTPSAKEKYNRAYAAGLITPLEGKPAAKKEEILRGQAKIGFPLPEGRTPSEKALVAKIKETTKKEASLVSSKVSIPSEKLRQAKAAGLLTPLQGKPLEKKEKILTGLAEAGLPLPKGETPSEKSLIRKVQTRYGIPKARTPSEKEIIKRAKAEGLLTPLKGKTLAQKEKILKGLAEAGLPMPEGTTQSEKALVQKVRSMAGLPPEPTPSEKRGKIKRRSKKIGVGEVSKSRKRVGISKSKGGVIEEFEDINKTTTCDRACGCDKKKIRFKHSYVKIRVTSPDISSLCPCPEECVPGVKGGVFTDNEGIKVTIGRVTGVPSFPSRESSKIHRSDTCPDLIGLTTSMNVVNKKQIKNSKFSVPSPITNNCSDFIDDFHKDDEIIFIKSFNSYHQDRQFLENDVVQKMLYSYEASDSSSMESIYLLKSNSATSLTAAFDGFSIISFSVTETSSCSSCCLQTSDYLSLENDQINGSKDNYCRNVYTSGSTFGITNLTGSVTTYYSSKILTIISEKDLNREIVLEAIQSESYNRLKHLRDHKNLEPFTSCMSMNSKSEILDTVNRVLSKNIFNDSSSLIIIMSTSSDEYDENDNYCYLNNTESIIFIQVSENCSNWNSPTHDINSTGQNKGLKLVTKGKNLKDMTLKEIDKNERQARNDNLTVNEKHYTGCKTSQKVEKTKQIFSNDTSEDRPCCCKTSENNGLRPCCVKEKRFENITPEFKTRVMLNEDVTQVQGVCHEALMNINNDRNFMIPLRKSILNPTPVRLCEIPTCSGHTSSHRPTENTKPIIYYKDPCNKLMDSYRPADSACSTCSTPKWDENNKKVKIIKGKSGCPCSNFGYHGNQFQECDMSQANANMPKGEKLAKKNKNIKCECPEEQLEFQFDMEDWIDEAQIRKMKSDLTQTVSGFKLNILRKTTEPEMSFEEILKYYAEAYEQKYKRAEYEHIKPKTNKNAVDCRCHPVVEKLNKNAVDCRCPPVAEKVELPTVSDEPFQGIKFHISGKGSGSKGLSGILCFQLLQEAGFDCTE